jgi:hypothetical protein
VEGTNALAHCLDAEKPAMLRLLLDHDPGRDVKDSLLWAIYRGRSPEVLRMLVDGRRRRERVGPPERAHALRARVADGPPRPL